MGAFEQADVASLEAKLLGIELTDGERATLCGLIELAEQASGEVAGFGHDPSGLQPGRLGFLSDIGVVGTDVRPEGIIFASAGGLGSTRVTNEYPGGSGGDK